MTATTSAWFDDIPVLSKLPPIQAATKLREIGEDEVALTLEAAQQPARPSSNTFSILDTLLGFQDKMWLSTTHAFGYLAPAAPRSGPLPIQHAGDIAPDMTLKNASIKITLDRLRVAAYPGSGTHRVLFDFYAQNQVQGNVEHLHFNATYRVRDGQHAGIIGYPIFVGLHVGHDGVAFKCFTVNVQNDNDQAFLSFLESDVFKAGLQLTATIQPAIAPLSGIAFGLTRSIATRHRNVPVQDFYLGLDFSDIPTRARLAEGAYLVVQIPDRLQTVWDWSDWFYDPASGHVVSQTDPEQLIPYNYLIIGVSRCR